PKTYKDQGLGLTVLSVTDASGHSYPYSTSTSNDNLVLKIGDAASFVHGAATYNISYSLKNVVSFESDHDVLYWDVNGTDWNQPFGRVTARIHIPADIANELQDRQLCFTGSYGSTEQNCSMQRSQTADETVVTVQANNLSASENLSFVLAFNTGTFAKDKMAEFIKWLIVGLIVAAIVLPPVITLGIVWFAWRK